MECATAKAVLRVPGDSLLSLKAQLAYAWHRAMMMNWVPMTFLTSVQPKRKLSLVIQVPGVALTRRVAQLQPRPLVAALTSHSESDGNG